MKRIWQWIMAPTDINKVTYWQFMFTVLPVFVAFGVLVLSIERPQSSGASGSFAPSGPSSGVSSAATRKAQEAAQEAEERIADLERKVQWLEWRARH